MIVVFPFILRSVGADCRPNRKGWLGKIHRTLFRLCTAFAKNVFTVCPVCLSRFSVYTLSEAQLCLTYAASGRLLALFIKIANCFDIVDTVNIQHLGRWSCRRMHFGQLHHIGFFLALVKTGPSTEHLHGFYETKFANFSVFNPGDNLRITSFWGHTGVSVDDCLKQTN